jgi:Domain of unknown function (DUF4417)
MTTRSSKNWQSLPGNFDSLNTRDLFPSSNVFGIPDLAGCNFVPEGLVPYQTRERHEIALQGQAVHFFLDDYRFEAVWQRPTKTLSGFTNFGAVLTPDFSLYREYPIALQIWNVYRNRWCGAFWQSKGLTVIPTVSWSDEASYNFCFLGLPSNSVLAVSIVGIGKNKSAQKPFLEGLHEMLARLTPRTLLVYGETNFKGNGDLFAGLPKRSVEVVVYPSKWQTLRMALAKEVS